MTAKQKINFAKKQKNPELIIEAYNQYYQEQQEKSAYQRIAELEKLPERIQKLILAQILRRKLLGIDRQQANEIIRYFFKRKKRLWSNYAYEKRFNPKELLELR